MRHSVFRSIFNPAQPLVKVLDVVSSTANATSYTFSAANIGDLGSVLSISGDAYGTHPHQRSSGRKAIFVCVHGEDSATSFGISSVSIGGVNGSESMDSNGNVLATMGLYYWNTAALAGITGTDVVVTFSEAVTSCAIGVLGVENIGLFDHTASGFNSGTGGISLDLNPGTPPIIDTYALQIIVSTCVTETELFSIANGAGGGSPPQILYADANAEIAFAAAYNYVPQYAGDATSGVFPVIVSWDGTGSGVAGSACFV